MCGIAGIVSSAGQIEPSLLEAMCHALGHRGPDDAGAYIEQGQPLSVGLGARRLSIIDLREAGHQPMSNEAGDVWLAYNGELYNHRDLRRELEARGHRYRSRTDTETVIHAFEEYGVDCLSHFNGMFAFALYDRRRRCVLLARDRMGIKPLYYCWDGQELLFASELRALLPHLRTARRVSGAALSLYLSLGYVPSPYCLCEGVFKLPPGAYLLLQARQGDGTTSGATVSLHTYWLAQSRVPCGDSRAPRDLVARTRSTLEAAVERQLMSDLPVGVFLSGGIDSTIVTALANRGSAAPIDTFSVGFADSRGVMPPDSPYNQDLFCARQVARQLNTRHHEIVLEEGPELAGLLRDAVSCLDEPLWEPSFLSLHLMSELARQQGVIVILTGDGGDELFGGYPWYESARRLEVYERMPGLKAALPILATIAGEGAIGVKARDLVRRLGQSDLIKYRLTHEIFPADEKQDLIKPEPCRQMASGEADTVDPVSWLLIPALEGSGARDLPEKLALADLTLWVREHFNHRLDRMSMKHSVEARVPFQDNEVMDLALSIPMKLKRHGGTAKYLLRQACRDLLPKAVLNRPKRPLGVPAWSWLRGPLRGFTFETLAPGRIREFGVLEPEMVQTVVHGFMAGDDSLVLRAWVLLNLQLWCEAYL
jgi:asparagine synthase (glutamine-hydrolysing)